MNVLFGSLHCFGSSSPAISTKFSTAWKTAVFFAAALFASTAAAQSQVPASLNLETAVERALSADPKLKVSASRTRIADLGIKEAHSGKQPFAQFSQSVINSNNPVFVFGSRLEQGRFSASNFAIGSLNDPKPIFNFRTLVNVQMPVFDQRQTSSRVTQAEIGKKQAELDAESVRQQIRFDVIRTFYGVILGREMVKANDEAIRSAEANVKKARDMVEVGMTTDADLLAAEVELANAIQQRLEAESKLTVTVAALDLMLGERPDAVHEPIGDLREKYFPVDEQDQLIRIALDNRPDYLRADLAIRNNRSQTKMIRDQRLPRIDAFGNIGYSSPYIANGSTDYTVGLSLTYTLFDAGRRARVEQLAEAETAAASEKQVLGDQITLGVVRSLQDFRTAKAKIQVSIKSIGQADEALRIVQDRYKAGLTTFNEVIRAEAALLRSKHNLLIARYDYMVGYASLLLSTGKLNDVRLFD